MFGCIWDCFVALRYSVQIMPNYCSQSKSSSHKVAIEFFAINPPNPRHLILNSCYGAFHSVWGHLGTFCYDSKLGAKLAELVQLMQNSCHKVASDVFTTNAIDPPPLDPKRCFVLFRSVWRHFGPFRCFTILGSTRAELL